MTSTFHHEQHSNSSQICILFSTFFIIDFSQQLITVGICIMVLYLFHCVKRTFTFYTFIFEILELVKLLRN